MNMGKNLCNSQAKSGLPQASKVAVRADLNAPSFTAFDRIGSSLRHCFDAKNGSNDCAAEWNELLKKLG